MRRTRILVSICALGLVVGLVSGTPAAAAERPPLKLIAASDTITLESYNGKVYLDLGTHLVAGDTPFEVWVKRQSYWDPIVASQNANGVQKPLPDGLFSNFSGFTDFINIQLRNGKGDLVLDRNQSFCPNSWDTARARPDAPDRSPYADSCPSNPFTRGSVWGIQTGWSVPTFSYYSNRIALPNGTYTATVQIDERYRDMFGISTEDGMARFTVKVVKGSGYYNLAGKTAPQSPRPAAQRPTGAADVPADAPKPDLRALPSWDIQVNRGHYLSFAANVWNGGPSPLVVDGFRRSDQNIMDAYQYFYDEAGNQVGYAPAGTMAWDSRDGHHHWHFKNFARYQLLDSTRQAIVRSKKESFCLAATDAVDYTVPGADWQPSNTDLHTACGSEGSLSVREVLASGSGDTYYQYVAGQSFDINNLPNGKYFIEIMANPNGVLHEADTTNNISYREIYLGGTPDKRTVTVKAKGMIKTN